MRRNGLSGGFLKIDRLHVSLHHVGDYKQLRSKFVYAAQQAAKAVAMRRFEANFRFIKSFDGAPPLAGKPHQRPLVLLADGAALFELHHALGIAMKRAGLPASRRFLPHMTLIYGSEPVAMQAIDPIRLAVDAFVLIHSEIPLTRYNVLGRWSLAT